jgi:hypothetical protein
MKLNRLVLIITSIAMLSACVVRPGHKGHKVRAKAPARTLVVLDQEHNGKTILVVNTKHAVTRNCWVHKKHWHCKR